MLGNALRAIAAAPELSDIALEMLAQEVRFGSRFRAIGDPQDAAMSLIERAIDRGMPAIVAVAAVQRGFILADCKRGAVVPLKK